MSQAPIDLAACLKSSTYHELSRRGTVDGASSDLRSDVVRSRAIDGRSEDSIMGFGSSEVRSRRYCGAAKLGSLKGNFASKEALGDDYHWP